MTMAVNVNLMAMNDLQDSLGVIAGIDDQSFARFWVADNVAIALQHSDRQDFVNDFALPTWIQI